MTGPPAPFETQGPPRYRMVWSRIRSQIVSGELRPGQRLSQERELARGCGVARITVRAARQLLAAEGLISRCPRIGTIVRNGANPAASDDVTGNPQS